MEEETEASRGYIPCSGSPVVIRRVGIQPVSLSGLKSHSYHPHSRTRAWPWYQPITVFTDHSLLFRGEDETQDQGSHTQSQPNRRPKGPQVWGGVIKPVSWRIWSSTWVTASSCMTWPPRTNSRHPWSTSWQTLALWAERKSQVTTPELCLVAFVGDMPVASHGASFKLPTFIYSATAGPCLSWSALCPVPRPAPGPWLLLHQIYIYIYIYIYISSCV